MFEADWLTNGYAQWTGWEPNMVHTIEDLGTVRSGRILVKVRPDVLRSKEAVLGVLRHEFYEIEMIQRDMAMYGSLSSSDLDYFLKPPSGKYHIQAILEEDRIVRMYQQSLIGGVQ